MSGERDQRHRKAKLFHPSRRYPAPRRFLWSTVSHSRDLETDGHTAHFPIPSSILHLGLAVEGPGHKIPKTAETARSPASIPNPAASHHHRPSDRGWPERASPAEDPPRLVIGPLHVLDGNLLCGPIARRGAESRPVGSRLRMLARSRRRCQEGVERPHGLPVDWGRALPPLHVARNVLVALARGFGGLTGSFVMPAGRAGMVQVLR